MTTPEERRPVRSAGFSGLDPEPEPPYGACWIVGAHGVPFGARRLGIRELETTATERREWVVAAMFGNQLPQLYRVDRIYAFEPGDCDALGLCPACLGFGDTGPTPLNLFSAARVLEDLTSRCSACQGSGRPCLRISMVRTPNGGRLVDLAVAPHGYIRDLPRGIAEDTDHDGRGLPRLAAIRAPADMCIACGMTEASTGTHGGPLHV